jgi:hypothetical protein
MTKICAARTRLASLCTCFAKISPQNSKSPRTSARALKFFVSSKIY